VKRVHRNNAEWRITVSGKEQTVYRNKLPTNNNFGLGPRNIDGCKHLIKNTKHSFPLYSSSFNMETAFFGERNVSLQSF
jgi:hypothetical protein